MRVETIFGGLPCRYSITPPVSASRAPVLSFTHYFQAPATQAIARFPVSSIKSLLLVFSVMPFKIDQNKNQNRSMDKVQNLGNERRYIYKDPHQGSGQRNISYTRYPKKCFTQTYRDLYRDAMLVHTWMSSNMADGNQQKPASFPVVLGYFGCDVTCQACRENSPRIG